jgi:spore maturation protein SpmA
VPVCLEEMQVELSTPSAILTGLFVEQCCGLSIFYSLYGLLAYLLSLLGINETSGNFNCILRKLVNPCFVILLPHISPCKSK